MGDTVDSVKDEVVSVGLGVAPETTQMPFINNVYAASGIHDPELDVGNSSPSMAEG